MKHSALTTVASALPGFGRRHFRLRHWPGIGLATAFFFAYCYLPIIILIALSFNDNRTPTIWTEFSLK